MPLFQQRWTFFAPSPPMQTLTVVARGKTIDSATGKEIVTSWIDVSDPLIEEERRSRFSPLGLVQLGLSNATMQFTNDLGLVTTKLKEKDREKFMSQAIPKAIDPLDIMAMNRTAESSLGIQFPGVRFTEVQVAVAIHRFPKYEDRNSPDDPKNVTLLPIVWQKTHDVARFCCGRPNR